MSLKGPIFPKIKAALKSLIKDKTKEHTVKITPFGATKHLIVGKTDPLMLGINIEETQNGFIYIGEEELEGAVHQDGISYLPIPSERFNHVRKFFEMKHEPFRSRKSGLFARRKGILHAKDVQTTTAKQAELQQQLKKKDRELKRQEKEIENFNRKVATQRGRLADALAIGILPADVELPISLENVSRLTHGADGLVIEIDEKERWLHLHFIETNYSSGKGEPELTPTQRKLRTLIKRERVSCHFHHWYVDESNEWNFD
ncbi:hypothetical protein N8392_01710 [Candidatus Poseidonia sp.]|nr:hypothetical protein [Poseidonia sp.]